MAKIPYPPGATAEQRALIDYKNAGNEFTDGGAARYEQGEDLEYEDLGELDRQGPSGYNDIKTDPRYKDNTNEALRQLEEQSKNGYSARDKADQAKITSGANIANRGRQGAIQQQMEGRGLAGSGLDFIMKQQAAQDSAEGEAMQALELNAQMQDRKQNAAAQMGNMSTSLQGQEFNQQAQKASANDAINRFNTSNSNQRQIANNQGQNNTNNQNWNRRNQTSDKNVNADYTYRQDKMGVNQNNAEKDFNYSAAQREAAEQRARDRKAKRKGGIGMAVGLAGGAAGAYFGGPAGAAAGYSAGNAIGSSFAHGGKVEGHEVTDGDDASNDIIPAYLSAGEIVIPKSHANDPMKAAEFVAKQNNEEMDPLGHILAAMALMNKGKK